MEMSVSSSGLNPSPEFDRVIRERDREPAAIRRNGVATIMKAISGYIRKDRVGPGRIEDEALRFQQYSNRLQVGRKCCAPNRSSCFSMPVSLRGEVVATLSELPPSITFCVQSARPPTRSNKPSGSLSSRHRCFSKLLQTLRVRVAH